MKNGLLLLTMIIFLAACTTTQTDLAITEEAPTATSTPEPSPEVEETAIPATATATPEPTPEPIGMVNLEEDQVEHGASIDSLVQIFDTVALFTNDAIRITDGGEALLDFGDKMQMRLFNDTELEIVSAEIGQDVPLGVRFFLYRGGFTGQLTEKGNEAIYETPGGVEITILGTTYFVIYDEEREETTVGNFEGSVAITHDDTEFVLEDGFYVVIPDNQEPMQPQPLLLTFDEFEARMRADKSPPTTARLMSTWMLNAFLEWSSEPDLHQFTWDGSFQVNEGVVAGEGVGIIEIYVVCPSAPTSYYDIDGTFDFIISGESVDDGTISLVIQNENLEMTDNIDEVTSDPDYCRNSWHNEVIAGGINAFLNTFSIETNEIILDLTDGASTVVEIPEERAQYTYNVGSTPYEDAYIYAQEPITITINNAILADPLD